MFKFNKINNFNYNESENSLDLGMGEEKKEIHQNGQLSLLNNGSYFQMVRCG